MVYGTEDNVRKEITNNAPDNENVHPAEIQLIITSSFTFKTKYNLQNFQREFLLSDFEITRVVKCKPHLGLKT